MPLNFVEQVSEVFDSPIEGLPATSAPFRSVASMLPVHHQALALVDLPLPHLSHMPRLHHGDLLNISVIRFPPLASPTIVAGGLGSIPNSCSDAGHGPTDKKPPAQ